MQCLYGLTKLINFGKTKTNTNTNTDPNRYRRRCPGPNARIQKFRIKDCVSYSSYYPIKGQLKAIKLSHDDSTINIVIRIIVIIIIKLRSRK